MSEAKLESNNYRKTKSSKCAATIITQHVALTAAHCICGHDDKDNKNPNIDKIDWKDVNLISRNIKNEKPLSFCVLP